MKYNQAKPSKWRIRIYVLATQIPVILIRPDLPVSSRIPLDLYRKLLDNVPNAKGYHMYTDRYYTSIPLAEELLKMNCFLTGTIKTNRKYLPMAIKKPQFFSHERTKGFTRNEVGLVSVHRRVRGGELVRIQKPKMVIDYTKNMRGVDRADQYAATYCFLRKSLKWWRKLLFWGDGNVYIRKIVGNWLGIFDKTAHLENTLTHQIRRAGSTTTYILYVYGTKKDCAVCSNRKISGERRQTHYFCDTCLEKPRLHIGNCFERYHTLNDYKM
ncbi:piggyBac transposable element-derived protein 4-like [Vespula squamosa]|uniref:PiggyBac transposable element-derived protein 4-like n=1 Tax=Vespula squamosa TaxID=30214 RepID=A0ABD2BG90_VESSQ